VLGPAGELVELNAALEAGDPSVASIPDFFGVVPGALPPAPQTVVRETHYYGTVTIDHRAHLARRAKCFQCHGPGPVRKIEFTPKIAHERCIGCHQAQAKGPDKCKGCHVKPEPPPEELAAAAQAAAAAAEPPPPPQPNAENVAAALASFDAAPTADRRPDPFAKRLELGLAAGGDGVGLSVRFVSTQSYFVLAESLESMRSGSTARTMLLFTGGVCRPFTRDIMIETTAVAGLDVFDRPVTAAFPALGLRTSAQFRQPAPFLQHLSASLTWTADLTRHAFGQDVGGYALFMTIATGFRVP
jgi:hypothetical protein